MSSDLPAAAHRVGADYPEVWDAFTALGKACGEAGPLDARTRHLVKLAIALAGRSEGATHSHVRRALGDGVPVEELRHVALLAAPTLGLQAAVAGLTWIDDIARAEAAKA
ncbi:MAG: carboxymuconolactone decarboxylase family protein [Rhodospirillaceae bacterium]|nr:carboxymuconolactone decarboxylase family protein [Rhodospirillaceae bacterium]